MRNYDQDKRAAIIVILFIFSLETEIGTGSPVGPNKVYWRSFLFCERICHLHWTRERVEIHLSATVIIIVTIMMMEMMADPGNQNREQPKREEDDDNGEERKR